MGTPALPFPHADWGVVRLVALGGIVWHPTSPQDFRIEGVFDLINPPPVITSRRIRRIVIELPVGNLPAYRVGTEWRGGRLVAEGESTPQEIEFKYDGENPQFSKRPISGDLVPNEWVEAGLPDEDRARAVGIRLKQVSTSMLRVTASGVTYEIPCWEILRFFHAWTTDLAKAMASGPTGQSVAQTLCYKSPVGSARIPVQWPEHIEGRTYRIRLRDDLAPDRVIAAQVVWLLLNADAATGLKQLQSCFAGQIAGARLPKLGLPIHGQIHIKARCQPIGGVMVVDELLDVDWSLPFDHVELVGLEDRGGTGTTPKSDRARPLQTVERLTDRIGRRQRGRPGQIHMSNNAFAERVGQVVTGVNISETRQEWSRRKVSGPQDGTVATSFDPDGLLARGITEPAESAKGLDGDIDDWLILIEQAAADIERTLRETGRTREKRFSAIEADVLPRIILPANKSNGARTTLAGRACACLSVVVDAWQCVVVDLAREHNEMRHRHSLAIVYQHQGLGLPAPEAIADSLIVRNGTVPRSQTDESDPFIWVPLSHPHIPAPFTDAARVQWQGRLARKIARGVANAIWPP